MTGQRQDKIDDTHSICVLARAWWELVLSKCPQEWCDLLPEIDFDLPQRRPEAQSLPVVDYLPGLANQAPAQYRVVIDALVDARQQLYFGQSYTAVDIGEDFLQQYGWVKLLGPDGYWHSERLSSGFLILGDRTTYPQHCHEAEELYLPISGDAEWYCEGQGWQLRPAGTLIHHVGGIRHGTRTIGEALVTLYLWRGGDLAQKSTLF